MAAVAAAVSQTVAAAAVASVGFTSDLEESPSGGFF